MAELHDALKYLGPADWATIPTETKELSAYLNDLFSHTQVIVDSVPLPSPDDAPLKPQTQPTGRARKASEVTLSSERSSTPPFGHEKLQKEWGKPQKIKPTENPLGVSLYKMSGKDSGGSWFARRSVHEGIGFTQFKKSLQMEFEKSLAEQGPPGTGNVRGIGGEERVEQIKTDKGNVEVIRLSAQFPGPTAARDFVTLLVTSDTAMHIENETRDHRAPRHYMIISRPCNHPQTQPRQGFVRGFYESVEFIREVPRKLKATQSSIDLGIHEEADSHARKRASTVGQSKAKHTLGGPDPSNPDDNPVEWMMITRSDPGGGIPRFLVERGTPGSICGDAVKFMDWACQNVIDDTAGGTRPPPQRRESHLVGIKENEKESFPKHEEEPAPQPAAPQQATEEQSQNGGWFGTVSGAAASLRSYAPQAVLDRLPAEHNAEATSATANKSLDSSATISPVAMRGSDDKSIASSTSFASAEDHWSSAPEDDGDAEAASQDSATGGKENHHEKELRKLDDRKQALHKKYATTKSKIDQSKTKHAETEASSTQKAVDKHEKELKKHQEKYEKELAKIERKQDKERHKALEKAKKAVDKDEKSRLTRERDEARAELDLSKREADSLRAIVADLQKENTALVVKMGKAGLSMEKEGNRSRTSSVSRLMGKDKDKDLVASAAASVLSNESPNSNKS